MSVVVDASVIVALLVADQRQAGAQAHLERWVDSGEELHAPPVLPYEVAKVVARLVFDGNLQANSVAETWSDLAALGASSQPSTSPRTVLPGRPLPRSYGAATPLVPRTSIWRSSLAHMYGPSMGRLPATAPTSACP